MGRVCLPFSPSNSTSTLQWPLTNQISRIGRWRDKCFKKWGNIEEKTHLEKIPHSTTILFLMLLRFVKPRYRLLLCALALYSHRGLVKLALWYSLILPVQEVGLLLCTPRGYFIESSPLILFSPIRPQPTSWGWNFLIV